MPIQNILRVFCIGALALFLNSALAQESQTSVKGPKIQLVENNYDFGTVTQGPAVKHTFKFKNVGTDTLRIEQVKTSCGCTAAESSKIIAPQGEGQIDVTFNTANQMGRVSKTVFIYSNDVEAQQRSLTIHGTVEAKKVEVKTK
ncbi:DUF1573 domain-containing protein [candidate division KSB1 bacterium]|nr:DUF1573 domain-containing protein [candidate division KSB1 bacterium]